jgi:hypothetical protein
MFYVVKAKVSDPDAARFVFARQKVMYGGRRIAAGDEIFVFASDHEGGRGLVARGVVTKVAAVKTEPGRTPRVTIEVRRIAKAKRRLGREELKPFRGQRDESPQGELDFKFYRQATNKIGGVTEKTGRWLRGRC